MICRKALSRDASAERPTAAAPIYPFGLLIFQPKKCSLLARVRIYGNKPGFSQKPGLFTFLQRSLVDILKGRREKLVYVM